MSIISRVLARFSKSKIPGQEYIEAPDSTRLDDVQVFVRADNGGKRLLVGADAVISGNFTFERGQGSIVIGDRTFIGGGTFVCSTGIQIGSDVMFSWGCTVIDTNAHSTNAEDRKRDVAHWKQGLDQGQPGAFKDWSNVRSAPVVVEDGAWIGFNSIILKGVTIGAGAIVAAGSVVTKDVAPGTTVAGNPAKTVASKASH